MTSQPDMQGLDPKALEAATSKLIGVSSDGFEHDRAQQYAERIVGAYLASLPQQTAEPVAWRIRERPGFPWEFTDYDPRRMPNVRDWEAEPLYTHPASPPVGGAVKVKTLEWRTIGSLQQAETSIGWYTVIREPNAEEFPWLVSLRGQGLQSFMREADAKDFAQRHFTECIQGGVTDNALSSLASSERSGREAATHRHVKRGTEYVLIGCGRMQTADWVDLDKPNWIPVDMREVAIYRAVSDGSLWVRPREEFEDGRFEAIRNLAGTKTNG